MSLFKSPFIKNLIVCVYLVKEAVDLCECVCNWQVEELGEVVQPQPVSLQLPGSSGLFLQHRVCASCSQPVNAQQQEIRFINKSSKCFILVLISKEDEKRDSFWAHLTCMCSNEKNTMIDDFINTL